MIQKRATSVAFFILLSLVLCHAGISLASEAVYKCGNTLTNDSAQAKREKCQLLEGGAVVTIPPVQKAVTVTKPKAQLQQPPQSQSQKLMKSSSTASTKSAEQQARDHDAKAIIEAELKKTEAQLVDLRKQFQQLSAQTDTERKLAVKQQMARAEADIVSLKRELKR